MLIQFSVKNFRSIKDEMLLSMVASSDKSHERNLIQANPKTKLLPVAAIFGANAAGKSNILLALQTMQSMITGENAQLLRDKKLPYDPFAFHHGDKNTATEFSVIFFFDGIKYSYGFGYNSNEILFEYLNHWPKGKEAAIFSREKDQYKFMEKIGEQNAIAGRTPANKLYLVSSNEWNAALTASAYSWFSEKLFPYDEQNSPDATTQILRQRNDNPLRERILAGLRDADLGIYDVGIDESRDEDNPRVFIVHKTKTDRNEWRHYKIRIESESAGTQRIYARLAPWHKALENGGILFVDEIDASMHPLMTRKLVELFQNRNTNPNDAQLVFTTHDTMFLDLSFMRRDQIWFVEKDEKSLASSLYSLLDYSARKDESIQKGYLQGRYGAVPFFGGEEQ